MPTTAAGWITYADTSELILTIGVTEAAAIAAAHAIGEDTSGEEYAWLCAAPATARLMAASDDQRIRWRLIDGVADLID